jgi:hypothetical protein
MNSYIDKQMTPPLENHFNRGKIFYPLVMYYVVQLAGFRDLLVSSISGRESVEQIRQRTPSMRDLTLEQFAKLRGPLHLRSEFQSGTIEVDVDEICREINVSLDYLAPYQLLAAGGILILAEALTRGRD